MKPYFDLPENQNLVNQDTLTEISLKDFKDQFAEPQLSCFQKVYRVLTFFIFLGPIRILIFFTSIAITLLFTQVFYSIKSLLPFLRISKISSLVMNSLFRICVFSIGVVKINKKGSFHSQARLIVSNHHCLVDSLVVFSQIPCGFVAASYLKSWPVIKIFSRLYDFVFVDRSVQGNFGEQIKLIAANHKRPPLLLFPEGKCTDGRVLVGFRSGAFLTDEIVQPVTIRYRHWFVPKGTTTISWVSNKDLEYFLQLFATPFYTVDLNVLPIEEWKNKEPWLRARQSQLQIANALGIPAINRSNRDLFSNQ